MQFVKRWFAASLLLAATPAAAETFDVTRADDPVPDGCLAGDCSLREALDAAVATPGADTIVLGAGQYTVTIGALDVVGEVAIAGAGAAVTRIVGNGAFDLLHVTPLGELTVDGATLASQDSAVDVDSGTATLRDVRIPAGGGLVNAVSDNGAATLRVEHSELGDPIGCECGAGSVQASDTTLNAVLVFNGSGDLVLDRVDVVGPSPTWGVAFTSAGTATIRDSTIRGHAAPLVVGGDGGDVSVSRTRFIGNSGPIAGIRDGTVRMQDVEFRDNVVDDAHLQQPAVLVAQAGTGWRISRALFVGNRGGGGSGQNRIGSTVRVLAGANVVLNTVTFYDNTFRSDVANGIGNAIGVDVADSASTIFWMFHATLQPGPFVPDDAVASLLAVRGAAANVRVHNSILHGTCAFAGGASMFQAEGNIESPNDTCRLPPPANDVDVPASSLFLGPLADNGGFTRTFLPTRYSPAIDRGVAAFCLVANAGFGALDQRRYLRPADGVDCDTGAAEAGAPSDAIFADGFDLRDPMALRSAWNRE